MLLKYILLTLYTIYMILHIALWIHKKVQLILKKAQLILYKTRLIPKKNKLSLKKAAKILKKAQRYLISILLKHTTTDTYKESIKWKKETL